jgi:hypothetical protein
MFTWPYHLKVGHSDDPAAGTCAMDAINWLVHGEHGDHPKCACPLITGFVIRSNDLMPDDVRQGLLIFLHRIAGSLSEASIAARLKVLAYHTIEAGAQLCDTLGLQQQASAYRALHAKDLTYSQISFAANRIRNFTHNAARRNFQDRNGDRSSLFIQQSEYIAEFLRELTFPAVDLDRAGAYATTIANGVAVQTGYWQRVFNTLDAMLNAGPQGEPWSADVVDCGVSLYKRAAEGLVA